MAGPPGAGTLCLSMADRTSMQPPERLMYALRQSLPNLEGWPPAMAEAVGREAEAPEVSDADLVQRSLEGERSLVEIAERHQGAGQIRVCRREVGR